MKKMIYRVLSAIIVANMLSLLLVTDVFAFPGFHKSKETTGGYIDLNPSDNPNPEDIAKQISDEERKAKEKEQEQEKKLQEYVTSLLMEDAFSYLDEIRVDFLSQFTFGELVNEVIEWDNYIGTLTGSDLDTEDFLSVRLLRTLGVEQERIDALIYVISRDEEMRESLERAESLFAYVIRTTKSDDAVDFFFDLLGWGDNTQEDCDGKDNVGNSTANKKPNIYFYGFEGELSVEFEVPQYLKESIPTYESGWKVIAEPEGTLIDEQGNTYDYLFYEFYTDKMYYQTEKGFALPAGEWVESFTKILDAYGFTEEEKEDFIEFWSTELESGIDYVMYPQYTETADIAYPIHVNPMPDTSIRLWFVFKEDKGQGYTEETIEPFKREGKTMFEWGGMIFD